MAFITYPLNNIDYNASDAELYNMPRKSGVYAKDDFDITVSGADNNVTIGEGVAWIKNGRFSGKVTANKTPTVLDMGLTDPNFPRWDVIALQFDKNKNAVEFKIKKGIASSEPKLPEIVQSETIYELYLYKIYRPVGAVSITSQHITDLRLDTTVCGLMADSVTSVDTNAINQQINALIKQLEDEIKSIKDDTDLMSKSVYDTSSNGIVDNAERLGGQLPSYYGSSNNTWGLSGGKEIQENTDLNTISDIGNYYVLSNAVAGSLKNCPIIAAFTMKVIDATGNSLAEDGAKYILQILTNYRNGEEHKRYGTKSSSGWEFEQWIKTATEKDVEAVKTIADNAMPKSGGIFTGSVAVPTNVDGWTYNLKNMDVRTSSNTNPNIAVHGISFWLK